VDENSYARSRALTGISVPLLVPLCTVILCAFVPHLCKCGKRYIYLIFNDLFSIVQRGATMFLRA